MRSTALNIGLAFWLFLSLAVWMLGFAFAGNFYLPPLNLFTALLIYAPWLLLLVIGITGWRLRHRGRS